MEKILEKIDKNEIIEYFRSDNAKFSVGNFVGKIEDFAVFTSVSPFGKNEGYRFVKFEDLTEIALKTGYLKLIEKKISMRNSKKREKVKLKKENFFNDLLKYFIKNKIMLRVTYKDDNVYDSYLMKFTKDFFYMEILENDNYKNVEIVRRSQIKCIEIGKHSLEEIIVLNEKIEKNKFIDTGKGIQGDVIFQDKKYILIYEKDLFYGDNNYVLVKADDVWEISEKASLIEAKEISLEKIFPNILEFSIHDVLKKCCDEKIVVNFEYENSYYERYGIIEKIGNKRLGLKEIDKINGVFNLKNEILIDEISFMFIKNYSIFED